MTENLTVLRNALQNISDRRSSTWVHSLEERKLKELEFHDRSRDPKAVESLPQDIFEQLHGNKKYYSTTALSNDYFHEWIRKHSPGKIVLDFACGNGNSTLRAAKAGAKLAIGIDISGISIENAKKRAVESGLTENTYFVQTDCERTELPDNSIDVIICSGMLHHLDLSYAFYEMRRILKPGGVIFSFEALDYNPAIKLYRKLTPQMRTEWEKAHILSYKDIEFAKRFFEVKEIKHWHLFSILGVKTPKLLPLFNWLDTKILAIPGVKLLSWMFTFELHKPLK